MPKDKFYTQGENFFINGQLQEDQIMPPSFADIANAVYNDSESLDALEVKQSSVPLSKPGNRFTAYLVKTHCMEQIHLAYIKVCMQEPDAASVMMAYKLNNQQGSCDDGEYNTGYKLLKLIQSRKLRNVAVFVARQSKGQHLGVERFKCVTDVATALLNRYLDPAAEALIRSPPGSLPSSPASGRSMRRAKPKTK